MRFASHNDDNDSTEDEDDDEDHAYTRSNKNSATSAKDATDSTPTAPLSEIEKDCLLECIDLLNDAQRVQVIVQNVEYYLTDSDVLYALCEICHNLMIYNKMAIFEYKLVPIDILNFY